MQVKVFILSVFCFTGLYGSLSHKLVSDAPAFAQLRQAAIAGEVAAARTCFDEPAQ